MHTYMYVCKNAFSRYSNGSLWGYFAVCTATCKRIVGRYMIFNGFPEVNRYKNR